MEFVPLALACGHHLAGVGHFQIGGGAVNLVECPEGCGWVAYVIEPELDEGDELVSD